jgi:hypothetical protein
MGRGGSVGRKWGELRNGVVLNDGLGQGNTSAVFPDAVHGAAAQFDLWRVGYSGRTLHDAIARWSGGNDVPGYVKHLTQHTGIRADQVVTVDLLDGELGVQLMKWQAYWEAGGTYPLTDEQWQQAQKMVFGETPIALQPAGESGMYKLTWLPGVLRARGINVVEYPGWQNRGHGDVGTIRGVLCHHTCGPLHGDLPDVGVLVNGRSDLSGPLCNIGLGRSGTVTMIAAGAGYHAGVGNWQGITNGNQNMIGIEAENTGETKGARADTWPEIQLAAYAQVCAAILDHVGAKVIMCAGHKEYALPKGRKDDPNFDMDKFRERVAKLMGQPTQVAVSPPQRLGHTNVPELNVRASASASTKVVNVLIDKGHEVIVLDEATNGDTKWYRIGEGEWVAARFVTLA